MDKPEAGVESPSRQDREVIDLVDRIVVRTLDARDPRLAAWRAMARRIAEAAKRGREAEEARNCVEGRNAGVGRSRISTMVSGIDVRRSHRRSKAS